MQSLDNNTQAFLTLVRAGLWEQDVRLLPYGDIKWQEVYRLATEQSVLGLVLAGLEHSDIKPPKELLLQWIGEVQQIEQRNKAMNAFIADIIEKLRKENIYTLLVKGQGIAQCYEKPLWRSSGDVDFILSDSNYEKAKNFLIPQASSVEIEGVVAKHLGMKIDSWEVELHGTMRSNCLAKMDKEIDAVLYDVFYGGNVKSWMNGSTQVFLPRADEDVFMVFTHILKHFFHGGVGLRQICDWCRLLWVSRGRLNVSLLEKRLTRAGIITEWETFAFLSVNHLGMSVAAMPLYSNENKWVRKAERVMEIVFENGNFGHNREAEYYRGDSWVIRKLSAFRRYTKDFIKQFSIFPLDSIRVWLRVMRMGISTMFNGGEDKRK